MAEKSAKKTIAITIRRERPTLPRTLIATGFKLRHDKNAGLVDILLESPGQRGERVALDPVVMRGNLHVLKQYAASLIQDEDDSAQKDDVVAGETSTYANMMHVSQMAGRAETIFGAFSVTDWVDATRQAKNDSPEVRSYDVLVAYSTAGFQKKLLLELVLLLSQEQTQ